MACSAMMLPSKHAIGLMGCIIVASATCAFADPIRFTDGDGQEVTLPQSASRVAVLPITAASTFIAVDQSISRLASIHPRAKKTMMDGLFGRMYPGISNIPAPIESQGSDMTAPNAEAIAAVHPDLVIQSSHGGGGATDSLARVGLVTAMIRYGTEDFVRESLRIMAASVGKPERAESMISWRDRVMADLKLRLQPIRTKPRVLYITNSEGGYRASGSGNYIDFSIKLAGGLNAAEDMTGAQLITKEQILVWNPDIILLPSFGDRISPKDVMDDPLLSVTNAGRDRKVYRSPMGGYRWEAPAQENPLYWMWLANLLHPEMKPYNLRHEITEAYHWMYGYEVTKQDQDEMLQLSANSGSVDYPIGAEPSR